MPSWVHPRGDVVDVGGTEDRSPTALVGQVSEGRGGLRSRRSWRELGSILTAGTEIKLVRPLRLAAAGAAGWQRGAADPILEVRAPEVIEVLRVSWATLDGPVGKRLALALAISWSAVVCGNTAISTSTTRPGRAVGRHVGGPHRLAAGRRPGRR